MTHGLKILSAAAATLLLASACTPENEALNRPPGTYQKTTTSTDAAGTTTQKTNVTDVQVDQYGKKRAVVQSKTTKDPKGLFNKQTTSQTKEVIREE